MSDPIRAAALPPGSFVERLARDTGIFDRAAIIQPHPYADHPAALVLADHQPRYVTASTKPVAPVRCVSDDWEGQWCDFAAHQTDRLDQAGLLARPDAVVYGVDGGVRFVDPLTHTSSCGRATGQCDCGAQD